MSRPMLRSSFTALMFLALAASARGGTLYVANNGVDGPACGPKKSPCRSISQAVNTNAVDGDAIVVGPGTYGDLNRDGTLGNVPGEETGDFGCVLVIGHAVTITSSAGAAETVIDGRSVSINCNVGILVDGTQFGKPGKGFTVSNTAVSAGGSGIVVTATNVAIRGNQIVGAGAANQLTGIRNLEASGTVLIEANQVIGWANGIEMDSAGKTLRRNQVLLNGTGIWAFGSNTIVGNVTTANFQGVLSNGSDTIVSNAAYGNVEGITLSDTVTGGSVEKNNIVGNQCGVLNAGVLGVDAIKNYWGAATGPGTRPADDICNEQGGTATVTPFATKPFEVKAPIKP